MEKDYQKVKLTMEYEDGSSVVTSAFIRVRKQNKNDYVYDDYGIVAIKPNFPIFVIEGNTIGDEVTLTVP